MQEGDFVWYELMTTDAQAAGAFYAQVIGWTVADSGMPGLAYTLASVGDQHVAGLMDTPEEAKAAGARPAWFGYVGVGDVDAAAASVQAAGGSLHKPPADIPGVGRFAVVADPQGAAFMLFRGSGTPPAGLPPETPGTVGWHELHARDWQAAFDFYSGLYGWTKAEAVDMGPAGTYQLFAPRAGAMSIGGMWSTAEPPRPFWLYYFRVEDIDTAAARVTEAGGEVTLPPMQVPGGSWILQGTDPQGAQFALVGARS